MVLGYDVTGFTVMLMDGSRKKCGWEGKITYTILDSFDGMQSDDTAPYNTNFDTPKQVTDWYRKMKTSGLDPEKCFMEENTPPHT